jgi:WD40 repeat protein
MEVYNYEKKKILNRIEGHTNSVRHIIFSQDGKHLYSASEDKTVKIWQIIKNYLVKTLNFD